jgi:hypothetical protein
VTPSSSPKHRNPNHDAHSYGDAQRHESDESDEQTDPIAPVETTVVIG